MFALYHMGMVPGSSSFKIWLNPPRPLASGRVDPFCNSLYTIYTYNTPPLPLPDGPAPIADRRVESITPAQKSLHFCIDFCLRSGSQTDWFWSPFGTLVASFFYDFSDKKMHYFLDRFWEAFWKAFGTPDPRKWCSRIHKTLILTKSAFSFQKRFLIQNGPQKTPNMHPKSH